MASRDESCESAPTSIRARCGRDQRLLAFVAAALVACGPRPDPRENEARGSLALEGNAVVTLADYFSAGEESVRRAWSSAARGEQVSAAVSERAERAVVRVRVHYGFEGRAHSTDHATGALVAGGACVVTVAHEIEVLRRRADARVEVVLADGRVLAGRARSFAHYVPGDAASDWALIDLVDAGGELPSLELAPRRAGALLVLGFPARHGLDGDGRVVLDDAGRALPLRPLHVLCAASSRAGDALELRAGCVPIGGISGAPCVDASGRLVAIQRALNESLEGGRATTTLGVVALDALRAELARGEPPR